MNNTGWIAVGATALALAVGGFLVFESNDDDAASDQPEPVAVATPQPSVTPRVKYPVPQGAVGDDVQNPGKGSGETQASQQPTPAPLPALQDSDAPLLAEAKPLFGTAGMPDFLVPNALIEHFVVTVENLDRQPIRMGFRPVRHVPGRPSVDGKRGEQSVLYLSASNAERYTPYVRALNALDPAQVAALYRRYYPLFQKAYKNLGYPRAYFNDRLIAVIDHLLETPVVEYPIPVVQPKVFYQFADPALEELSWGQKTLIRMGSKHMATVKTFLRALRAELTTGEHAAN